MAGVSQFARAGRPDAIGFSVYGALSMARERDGGPRLRTDAGELRLSAPVGEARFKGIATPLRAAYALDGVAGFRNKAERSESAAEITLSSRITLCFKNAQSVKIQPERSACGVDADHD